MRTSILSLVLALLLAAVATPLHAATCESLASAKLPDTTITTAQPVAAGVFAPPYGPPLDKMPAFCRVAGVIKPTAESYIRFEVWLPAADWNGKFLGVGNGGFAGSIGFTSMGGNLKRGYATAGTDTGHEGEAQDASWAYRHPEKVADFGYRALHLTVANAKRLIEAFYARPAQHSYFDSCSDGGREALMEAQRFPEDFDGILAGAPAYAWSRGISGALARTKSLLTDPAASISPIKIPAISAAVLAACDAADGVKDGIIDDPRKCHFDPTTILCKAEESRTCLTAPQAASLKSLYAPALDAHGQPLAPGYQPGAEEGRGGWSPWIIGDAPGGGSGTVYMENYFRYMVLGDPTWNPLTADLDAATRSAMEKTAEPLNATSPDLSGFQSRGGKLILYHGWNDPAIPALSTINYYNAVLGKMGAKNADNVVRLYMVPGMQHCVGGPGPNWFGQLGTVTSQGPQHGIYDALEQWVEKGVAPGPVIATKYPDDNPGKPPKMTRPLCPYPQTAKYKGSGDTNDSANFTCTEPAQPASLKGVGDDAAFALYLNEDRVGVIKTKWLPDGAYQNEATISMGGQSINVASSIVVDPNGDWTELKSKSPVATADALRQGDTAQLTLKDKVSTFDIKPGARLFDNYGPALLSQTVRLYDRAKAGKQTFPVIALPGVAMEGTLEYKDKVDRVVAGKDLTLYRYTYSLHGIDIELWADAEGRIYLGEVPAQHAAYVRDGYEALRQAPTVDLSVSLPKFEVNEQPNAKIAMRDGVHLATDLYLPRTDAKVPIVLIRTPYKKEMVELQARFYARRGYAVAVQDCRGRFSSEGVWEPFLHEAKDGFDTIEWLARQPWTNGKIGMIGGSYVGWVQWWAASEHPPHLVTIIPNVSPPDPFFNIPYEHGAFFILGAIWWADILESNATGDLSGAAMSKIGEKKYGQLLRALPVIDLDKTVLGKENPYWRHWIEHPVDDQWWAPADFLARLKDVNIPAFHQSGWFDGDGIGTKMNYLQMKEDGHANQKLTLGPWGHTDTAARRFGEHDFGPAAVIDLQRDYLRWFDHWLKGVDNGITKEPLVSIYVMGSNQWLHGDTYPLPSTKFTKLYLSSSGQANTSKGDGRLTFDPPSGAPADKYVYDPGDPTPDPDFDEQTAEQEKQVRSADEKKKEAEAHHEQVTAARNDILVYRTDAMKEPVTFAGPLSAILYASSSARDTDWYVSLIEIEKDGKTFPLAAGKMRARFRNSVHKPELLEPGKIYQYALDLWHTGITIPVGAKLQVEVASADFPAFSRNLNTGGHNETETKFVSASQTIYHDVQHPSHILLPIIPAAELKPQELAR